MRELSNQQTEALLAQAIDRSVPDLYEAVSSATVERESTLEVLPPASTKKKKVRPVYKAALGLCACLALILSLGSYQFFKAAAVIGLDVNPSVEVVANRFDRVLSVHPLNADGEVILADMDLKYVDLDTAINAIVGSMVLNGYFTPGDNVAMLVSVSGGSDAANDEMRHRVAMDIEQAVTASGGSVAILTQNATIPDSASGEEQTLSSVQDRAKQNGISYGMQVFLDRLLALDPTLDEGELITMSLSEIAHLVQQRGLDLGLIVDYDSDDSTRENIEDFIEDVDEDHWEQSSQQGSTPSGEDTITVEQAKSAALTHAGVDAADAVFLKAQPEWDDGQARYEVEFYAGNVEYDYEIDAVTGAVLSFDRDIEDYVIPTTPVTSDELISMDEAKLIALGQAPEGTTVVQCELDRDDGRYRYELELRNGRTEYECEIDAVTGAVLKWESDYDD